MANPQYGTFPNAKGWVGILPDIKIGLAKQRVLQADEAASVNLNGRFDWKDRVYRGDLLTPQFLLRPILHRLAQGTAPGTQPIRSGVVTQVASPNQSLSTLDRIRNNAR